MSNDNGANHLDTSEEPKKEWVPFAVALRPEFKPRLQAAAERAGLTPSAYARTILMREVARDERGAA